MSRLSNQQLISSLQNGEEEILFYLTKKYFQSTRRWLMRNSFRDSDTPSIFSTIIVKVCREIQQSKISANIDFELFFFNSLREYTFQIKSLKDQEEILKPSEEKEIIGTCFNILDETSRKILASRYVEKLSFEQIAVRLDFSNPVIAQFEFNKAFSQFEKISGARLNVVTD